MVMVQVLLGGITRLTGSGLSITEWKPILGSIPPLNEEAWTEAFKKYQEIGQFKHLNYDFSLQDFKFIYFWEWFHRLWGRLIGIVFIVPFFIFLRKGWIESWMKLPLVMLFLLGLLQAVLGWIMVKSGLTDDMLYVDHIRLAIHFMAAMGLFAYLLWFVLKVGIPEGERLRVEPLRRTVYLLLGLLVVQLVYGAFMAGLKAANFAPSWPTMNGQWIPNGLKNASSSSNWTDNPIAVQFIHRGLAYLLFLGVLAWTYIAGKQTATPSLAMWRRIPSWLVLLQLVLGILTVVNAPNRIALLWWGVAHQFTAMLLLAALLVNAYILSGSRAEGMQPVQR
jgi:cytochrome c oxidase assembly protein subunit 15